MDEQTEPANNNAGDMSLGGGVDIVPPSTSDSDDVEVEQYNDDIFFEEMTPQDHLKRLREKLHECTEEKREYLDGWQRLKADFINYKKRTEEERKDFLQFAREGFITDLLPVLESFQMAFANKDAWEKVDLSWRQGVEHIHSQFSQALTSHGLTEVRPLGEEFNPSEHTSVATVHTDDPAEYHKIAEVLQAGYKLNGKLLKSPRVKVYGDEKGAATSGV